MDTNDDGEAAMTIRDLRCPRSIAAEGLIAVHFRFPSWAHVGGCQLHGGLGRSNTNVSQVSGTGEKRTGIPLQLLRQVFVINNLDGPKRVLLGTARQILSGSLITLNASGQGESISPVFSMTTTRRDCAFGCSNGIESVRWAEG